MGGLIIKPKIEHKDLQKSISGISKTKVPDI